MKVKLLRAIPHYKAGDTIEMTEDQVKAYGKSYVEIVKNGKKEEEDKKIEPKNDENNPENKNEEGTDAKTEDIGDVVKNTALLTTNQTK